MNMSLVTIDAKEKSDDITNLLSKTFGAVNGMWIGAIANGKDHHYIWISTGNEMIFSNWSPGEPNFENSQEYCVLTGWTDKIKWNDGGCYSLQGVICEYNDNSSHNQNELKDFYEAKLKEELAKKQELKTQLQEELAKEQELKSQLQKELENEKQIQSQLANEKELQNQLQEELEKEQELHNQLDKELEKEQQLQSQMDKNQLLLQMLLDYRINTDGRNKLIHDVVVNIN
ncbi:uncharacterized protein LOC119610067 [Lucilia sericata]|uniref:uncharacterized protein LOC119610067 n=1 Tax=Lucilia sericata TaxID=13632 RepID=UPI0018A86A2F|nr:uncharacterized protein LOC119610067 [Lucilia sericata]